MSILSEGSNMNCLPISGKSTVDAEKSVKYPGEEELFAHRL